MSAAEILPELSSGLRVMVDKLPEGVRLSRGKKWATYDDDCTMVGYGIGSESPTIDDCILFLRDY